MKEKNIVDRVPTHAGRIKLTPVAGQTDVFDMVRADEPTVEGTPLDKATLDGISKNRLTGRYYDLTATKYTISSAGGAFNPLPISWNTTADGANSGGYSITGSGGISSLYRAFDEDLNTYWTANAKEPWIQLNIPDSITVTKMKISMAQPDSWSTTTVIQGQKADGTWVNLSSFSLPNSNLIEYTLNSPSTYKAYRLKFTIYESAEIRVYEWQISNWSSETYRYDYKLPDNVAPASWEKGQRVTVTVPNYTIVGVVLNTLNGVNVNTILQPTRKYELVYNGSTFDAKEV